MTALKQVQEEKIYKTVINKKNIGDFLSFLSNLRILECTKLSYPRGDYILCYISLENISPTDIGHIRSTLNQNQIRFLH